jgi:transcriptional regulator with XRE-family HTH domain
MSVVALLYLGLPCIMDSMATEIGTRIKRARERRRWSQRELAERLGVNRKTVDNWENGRTRPANSIGALEDVLGVRLDDEPEPELPTPEELGRLREHAREVLGPRSAAVEDAIDRALSGEPRPNGGRGAGAAGAASASGSRRAGRPS